MFSHDCPDCSLTVTLAPLCATAPFHELAMVCAFANAQVSTQLLSAVVPPFLMVMFAPNWLEFCGEIV
jgi:hypothetical protein